MRDASKRDEEKLEEQMRVAGKRVTKRLKQIPDTSFSSGMTKKGKKGEKGGR
ncbi:hypothetical protein OK016_10405 [Vibrio chagasii]|nr:hypothetical protein [Vibrio chagasii]